MSAQANAQVENKINFSDQPITTTVILKIQSLNFVKAGSFSAGITRAELNSDFNVFFTDFFAKNLPQVRKKQFLKCYYKWFSLNFGFSYGKTGIGCFKLS